ncbi:uncharacterized protein LOC117189262 [Drosophila miranda]|uniref:uncharacterized protein LOC117189262 n=1 Tax=Drosophila miranda TaxID=7229 RepID=UPI00143F568D|nr:uncharacterized protein LOC117189262 [Drosophila miranda]
MMPPKIWCETFVSSTWKCTRLLFSTLRQLNKALKDLKIRLGQGDNDFYAIVGIPLMLICLSNIGDVMATSFRFLYWRICCYVCTRTAKRPRNARSRQRSVRGQRYARSQPLPSFRRSMKMTQRSGNDSGLGPSMGHAHSDPELRIMGRGVGGGYDDREFGHRSSGGRNRRQQQIAAQPRQQRHNIYGV